MEKLVTGHNFRYINCYITRDPRPDDKARIPVSKEEYKKMKDNSLFIFSNDHYRGSYGTPYSEIINAVNDTTNYYVMDYLIQNRRDFDGYKHYKILIIPDSLDSLTKWVIGSTRLERLQVIQNEFKSYYSADRLNEYKGEGFNLMINSYGILDKTIQDVVNLVRNTKLG